MRGNVQDIPIIVVILLATSIAVMFGYVILEEFFNTSQIQANPDAAAIEPKGLNAMIYLGNAFVFLFVGFGIAAVISAFYTQTHPVFFLFSIFIFAFCVMVTAIYSDVFVELASTGILMPVAAEMTLMVDTMIALPNLSIILGVAIIIALYAKRSDIQLGGGQA